MSEKKFKRPARSVRRAAKRRRGRRRAEFPALAESRPIRHGRAGEFYFPWCRGHYNGTAITTRSYMAQNRDLALRFLRAFTRGMHRYRTDKTFSKKVLGKYGKINDDEILEGTWEDYAPIRQKSPRPSLKAIQFLIENQFPRKKPLPRPGQFVELSLV
jgi:hypothetical protein